MIKQRQKGKKQQRLRNVIFCESFTQELREQLLSQQKVKKLQWTVCQISWGNFHFYGYYKLFVYIKQYDCWKLNLQYNERLNILTEISNVRFPKLRQLDLTNNMIQSIDRLASMNLESIECLGMKDNHITHINGIKKARWPNLKSLILHKNKISDLKVGRIMASSQGKLLSVYANLCADKALREMAKYQSVSLEQYHGRAISKKNLIKEDKVKSFLQIKYPQASITY